MPCPLLLLLRNDSCPIDAHYCLKVWHESKTLLDLNEPGCLVCDVRMPEMSGLDLFEKLTAAGSLLPVIFITERAVEMRRASLMKKLQAHSVAELIRLITEHEVISEHRNDQRLSQSSW